MTKLADTVHVMDLMAQSLHFYAIYKCFAYGFHVCKCFLFSDIE